MRKKESFCSNNGCDVVFQPAGVQRTSGAYVNSTPAWFFCLLKGKHENTCQPDALCNPGKMLRHLVARTSLTLINGRRWRTHVAALMRQFVQFCKKTMAVHFIAMCLLGYISTAASFHSEEFRPAINQNTAVPEIGASAARSLLAHVLFVAPFRCRVWGLRLIFLCY